MLEDFPCKDISTENYSSNRQNLISLNVDLSTIETQITSIASSITGRELRSYTGSSSTVEDQEAQGSSNTVNNNKTERISSENQVSSSSRHSLEVLNEMKYLLKATNSLSTPNNEVQTSQENRPNNSCRRSSSADESNETIDLILDTDCGATECRPLNVAAARSMSESHSPANRSEAHSIQIMPSNDNFKRSQWQSTFSRYVSRLFWIILAAYAFTIILFLTETSEIDLMLGLTTQAIVQVVAFGTCSMSKAQNLLNSCRPKIPMIACSLLIGVAIPMSYFAYYYISLTEITVIGQMQVVFAITIYACFVGERCTLIKVCGTILCFSILLVFSFSWISESDLSFPILFNRTNVAWSSTKSNQLFGVALAFTASLLLSIATVIKKICLGNESTPYCVLFTWSALVTTFVSVTLLYFKNFNINEFESLFSGWNLLINLGLAFVSPFIYISQEEAAKRVPEWFRHAICSTNFILAVVIENYFGWIRNELIVLVAGITILFTVLMLCWKMYEEEQQKDGS